MTTMLDPVRTHPFGSQRGRGGEPTTPTVVGRTFAPGAGLRNYLSGSAGFRFQVGNTRVTVADLGRWVAAGERRTRMMKLVQLNGVDMPGAVTRASVSGTPGRYVNAGLPTSVTLDAGTTDYLASQEAESGDRW